MGMCSLVYVYFEKQLFKWHLNYNRWLLSFKKQQDRMILVQLKLLKIKAPLAQNCWWVAFISGLPSLWTHLTTGSLTECYCNKSTENAEGSSLHPAHHMQLQVIPCFQKDVAESAETHSSLFQGQPPTLNGNLSMLVNRKPVAAPGGNLFHFPGPWSMWVRVEQVYLEERPTSV